MGTSWIDAAVRRFGHLLFKEGGATLDHRVKGRPRAFSVIEWLLYCYAVGVLLVKSWGAVSSGVIPWADKTSIVIIVAFVSLVLARNYMVMHGIDNRDRHPVRELAFLDHNLGLEDFLERVLRVLIVLLVVISPKKEWLAGVAAAIGSLVAYLYEAAMGLLPAGALPGAPTAGADYSLLSYYGGVLFLLFVLFALWDLTAMWAVGRAVRRHRASGADGDPETLPAVVSVLDYMNIRQEGALWNWAVGHVRAGNLFAPYLRSAKAGERAAGLLFSIVMMVSALAGLSSLSAAALGAVAVVYYAAADRNGHYLRGLKEFASFPVKYLTSVRGGFRGGRTSRARFGDGA